MNIKKILILAIFAIAIVGIIAPTSAAIESANKDKVYSIESKEKSAANKITWNANGGTIGSKKTITTNVKKGSKIGKFPATPKRSGYTFSGWYTKKSGGSKITANTKPTKAVTYYAQWKKQQTKTLNANEKTLVGKYKEYGILTWSFNADGTYKFHSVRGQTGNWAATKDTIRLTNTKVGGSGGYADSTMYYMLGNLDGKPGAWISIYQDRVKDKAPSFFYEKM